MDTIAGLPEACEREFSEAVAARDDALAVLAAGGGGAGGGGSAGAFLGPPDLCWLQKVKHLSVAGGGGDAQQQQQQQHPPLSPTATTPQSQHAGGSSGGNISASYYHHVLGLDVPSSGALAGYFGRLTANVEKPGLLAWAWLGTQLSIARGFYCAYDAIGRADVRLELCVPGGVVCGVVDAAGRLRDADARTWRQVHVSAFVRAALYEPEMAAAGGCIELVRPAATPAAEASLLDAVEALYGDGTLPRALDPCAAGAGYGAAPEHCDLACYAVWAHFRARARWRAAAAFFQRLGRAYPAAAVWEAAALRRAGRSDAVAGLLNAALEAAPDSPPLLAAMAAECERLEQLEAAAQFARRAVRLQPRCRPAWLLLARCYVAEGRYAEALVTLNAVPTPPLPRDERELLLVAPPPEPARVTAPNRRSYSPDLDAARALAIEEAAPSSGGGGDRLLAYLPGAVLVNREPLEAGPWPDASPNRVTRAVLGAVYTQLQAIVTVLGWDGFLAVRSSVFVMHEPPRSPAAGPRTSAAAAATAAAAPAAPEPERSADVNGSATAAATQPTPQEQKQQQEQQPAQQQQQQQQQPGEGGHQSAATKARPATPSGGGTSTPGKPDGADPAAFYASRVQAALAGASPLASSAASRQHGDATPTASAAAKDATAQPSAAAAAAARDTGEGAPSLTFEPMAGRVLLLGRRTRRLGTAEELRQSIALRDRGSSGSGGGGGGGGSGSISTSLAARPGVERLSRLGGASAVASLPKPPATTGAPPVRQSSNPLLWQAVFGAAVRAGPGSASSTPPRDGGGGGKDAAAALPDALPRIRTRPLGEATEQDAAPPPPPTTEPPSHPQQHGGGGGGGSGGLARAGSLLLARGRSGSPSAAGAFGGAARAFQRHGSGLHSMASGTLSPTVASRFGSGAGGQVRALDADRAAVAAGRQLVRPGGTSGGGGGGGGAPTELLRWDSGAAGSTGGGPAHDAGVRLCVRWLDELVVALWHDLSAYLEWRVLDQTLREARGLSHAELVLASLAGQPGTASGEARAAAAAAAASSDGAGPAPPQLTAADWARRGFLAERLGHARDARTAFPVAAALGPSLAAYTALLRLETAAAATDGPAAALMSAQHLLAWHEARAEAALGASAPSAGNAGAPVLTTTPTPVSFFVAELAAATPGGADAVAAVAKAELAPPAGGSGGSGAAASPHPLLLAELASLASIHARDEAAAPALAGIIS